jgi:hypothetical protein
MRRPSTRAFRDLADDRFFLGKLAGLELGVDKLAIDRNLEPAAVGRHEFQVRKLLLARPKDLFRQTDGLGFIVSSGTVDDADGHDQIPLMAELPGRTTAMIMSIHAAGNTAPKRSAFT